ncbi:MAG: hypothetical protein H6999_10805 [Hahellaceae bacterium]|nr:hypothetical protein [Hahellaceae bacterium]
MDRLDSKQQGVLLTIAAQLIEADGNIAAQETELLNTLRKQMSPDVSSAPVSVSDLPGMFTSTSAKAAFLIELLGLAHADAEYHVTEKDFISNIATTLSVSELTLADMESWVCRQFALVREAEQFMEE